jgi:hypothetical protein
MNPVAISQKCRLYEYIVQIQAYPGAAWPPPARARTTLAVPRPRQHHQLSGFRSQDTCCAKSISATNKKFLNGTKDEVRERPPQVSPDAQGLSSTAACNTRLPAAHAALERPVMGSRGAAAGAFEIDLSPLKNNNRLRHLSIIPSNRS